MLDDILEKKTQQFLTKNLENIEEIQDVLNLVTSAYLTGMINLLTNISSQHKEIEKINEDFVKKLLNFMGTIPSISPPEIIEVRKDNINVH